MSKLRALYYVAIAETLSWIGLISAMIAKYGFDKEEATQIPGMVHGALFVSFVALAFICFTAYKWNFQRLVIVVLAAIPPFAGIAVVHNILRRAEHEVSQPS